MGVFILNGNRVDHNGVPVPDEAFDNALSRADLNELATELGIEAPDKFANKAALQAAIDAKLAESGE